MAEGENDMRLRANEWISGREAAKQQMSSEKNTTTTLVFREVLWFDVLCWVVVAVAVVGVGVIAADDAV